jgi:hypothetical protein
LSDLTKKGRDEKRGIWENGKEIGEKRRKREV